MNRLIFLLCLLLAVSVSWGNLALAGNGVDFTAAQQQAAAGDIQGALQTYLALTEAHPDSHEAFARLGGMQLLDQRYPEAVRSFQKAIMLGADSPRPFIGLSLCYLHMNQLTSARAALVEARQRGSGDNRDVDHLLAWIDQRERSTH